LIEVEQAFSNNQDLQQNRGRFASSSNEELFNNTHQNDFLGPADPQRLKAATHSRGKGGGVRI